MGKHKKHKKRLKDDFSSESQSKQAPEVSQLGQTPSQSQDKPTEVPSQGYRSAWHEHSDQIAQDYDIKSRYGYP